MTLTATVRNDGLAATAGGFVVRFYRGDVLTGTVIGEASVAGSLGYQATAAATLVWPAASGLVTITAVLDPQGVVTETNKGNNVASLLLGEIPAPAGLTVAGHAIDHSATLVWTPSPVSGIVRYRIYRAAGAAGPFHLVGLAGGPAYVDSLLSYGQTYYYRVAAEDGAGVVSPAGNVASATVPWPHRLYLPVQLVSHIP